jgi:hypothetical protein
MTGLKRIIKLTTEIADSVTDPKTKLQAFTQLTDGYKYIMELTTGGVIVTDALKYVKGQMDYLNNAQKGLLKNIKVEDKTEQEDIKLQDTNNDIF